MKEKKIQTSVSGQVGCVGLQAAAAVPCSRVTKLCSIRGLAESGLQTSHLLLGITFGAQHPMGPTSLS